MRQKQGGVAYGPLYLDKGEGMHVVKQQIDSFVKFKPVGIYFDVLGRKDDEELGQEYIKKVREYANKKLPYLAESEIHCSFSIDV